jgi:hypothetical protein
MSHYPLGPRADGLAIAESHFISARPRAGLVMAAFPQQHRSGGVTPW